MILERLRVHHIGYITDNIEETAIAFSNLGYSQTPVMSDNIQQVLISFLIKESEPTIELVQPLNEKSSVNKILNKIGVAPYHICYEVKNIESEYEKMIVSGFMPLFRPIQAAALNNSLICYFYHQNLGYIELVEIGS